VWLADRFSIRTMADVAEWSDADVYVRCLARGDAWISIDRASGVAKFEKTDRAGFPTSTTCTKAGILGTDGRCLSTCGRRLSRFFHHGIVLLQTHASKRPATWPLVYVWVLAPILLMLFLVHR
jgi:hypothetical protein